MANKDSLEPNRAERPIETRHCSEFSLVTESENLAALFHTAKKDQREIQREISAGLAF